ncbi:hypothetical protein Leryth_001850 [Lithospermum erythrorhizon]|nr:hypothetical protein Leryth_001850 [Lithospermum erythrorhizon]
MSGMIGAELQLSEEILSVIPTDPFEQLDLARKITSMAIASRVNDLDAQVGRLRKKLHERDRVVVELQDTLSQLQQAFHESQLRFKITREDNMRLAKERDDMALTAKKLSRDLAKLEAFKKQLLQSLNDDNSSHVETVGIGTYDQSVSRDYSTTEEIDGHSTQRSLHRSMDSAISTDDAYRQRYAIMEYVSPRLTPTGTPKAISPSVSPRGYYTAGSPQRTSGTASPLMSQYDGSGSLSSWFPSSQQSSVASSPPNGRPLPARPPRIDGKEFFRQARSRLTYEQFSTFLANIKELNAKRQSREETLRKAEEIFGIDNKDLYLSFQTTWYFTKTLHLFTTTTLRRQTFLRLSRHLSTTPTTSRPNIVKILEERGLLESLTSETLKSSCSDLTNPPLRVYCGFDPTAESLHLGNLLGLIVLSWFLRCGHRVVALIGGATGRVGDPSGKSTERPELDLLALEKNIEGIACTVSRILGRCSGGSSENFVILNNYDWWKDVRLLDFLKDVGRFARVGIMVSKESVKKRLGSEQGMSFTEFTYQLLQGYDFVHLYREEGVNVQIGGSDQWGNITAGTDLIRRILRVEDVAYGLTFPLLLKSDGTKFGKSEEGAVWLSPSFLSPYKFYQYLYSVPDADVVRFLKILTFLSMDEIEELEKEIGRPGYVPNTAQRRLAEEVTRFVHGQDGLDEALRATEALRPGAQTKLDSTMIEGIAKDVPSYLLRYDQILNLAVIDLCVSSGLIESKSAVRRLVKQGGLYLNNVKVDNEAKKIEVDDIVDGKLLLLSSGKKNKMVVRIIEINNIFPNN